MSDNTPRLPEGTYRARALEGSLGETSTGKPQVAVLFELVDDDWEGERINWYGYFSEKTEKNTIESLRRAGWTGDDLSDLRGLGSKEVSLVVEHETSEDGTVRARVRWVNGGGGLGLKAPMAADKAKAFAAKMKGKVVAVTQAMPKAAASEEEPF